jgi:hypothetical protein
MNHYRFNYLSFYRLLKSTENFKVEGAGISFLLWVSLSQMFREGISLVFQSDLVRMFGQPYVSTSACLSRIDSSAQTLVRIQQAATRVEGSRGLVQHASPLA